jgi:hypothetical protein
MGQTVGQIPMVDDRMECRPMMCASNKWAGTIQDLLVDILMYDRLLERNGQMRITIT